MGSLALGSVVLAGAGAGCCVATRRRDVVLAVAMATMVLAMADTMLLGGRLLPAAAWAVLVALLVPTVVVSGRGCESTGERAGHLAIMAVLLGAAAWHRVPSMPDMPGMAATAASTDMASMQGMSSMSMARPPEVVLTVALLASAGYAVWLIARTVRSSTGGLAERALGLGSVVAMAGMLLAM